MDFLNVEGEQYIKVSSVLEALDELDASTKNDESTPEVLKKVLSEMMSVLKNIFSSAAGTEKETLKTEKIDVIQDAKNEIVGMQ